MNDVTNAWLAEYERAQKRLIELTTGLSNAQANWRAGEKKWSVAECIDHLVQSMDTYARCMGPAIEKARIKGLKGEPPYGGGTVIGGFIVRTLRKGPSTKVPAPKPFRPSASEYELPKVRENLLRTLINIGNLLKVAENLPLGRIAFGTPVSPLVRVSLAQAFEIHAIHTHRHLDQIERIKQDPNFPKS